MTGAWIRMRASLLDHPKVVKMTRLLIENLQRWVRKADQAPAEDVDNLSVDGEQSADASRNVTKNVTLERHELRDIASRAVVTALLLRTWSSARDVGTWQGDDLLLRYLELADLDQMAGFEGFGSAMAAVGWAVAQSEGVVLPNFREHNGKGGALTDAERARAYRRRRKLQENGEGGTDRRRARGVTKTVTKRDGKTVTKAVTKRDEGTVTKRDSPPPPSDTPPRPCESRGGRGRGRSGAQALAREVARVPDDHDCAGRGPGDTWQTPGYQHAIDPSGWWWRKKDGGEAARVEQLQFKEGASR